MLAEVEIQESIGVKWAADNKNEHSLPQTNRGWNKVLQQINSFKLESDETFDSEHDCSPGNYIGVKEMIEK